MTKTQRAMIAANVFSLNESQSDQAKKFTVSMGYISQAAVVPKYAHDFTDAVIAGTTALTMAWWPAKLE